jgi:pimeloyl-ACP methyl ester carboxylesterase
MPTITVRGASLHYEERGQGSSTVVFSHGFIWSGRMFAAQMEALAPKFRCVALDHRGQGRSEVTPSGYSIEELTLDAAEAIQALGAAPCHFVGLSMGGFIGMRLAARRPELIRSLTLMETSAEPEPNVLKYKALGLVARLFGLEPVAEAAMKVFFGRKFLTDPARAEQRTAMRRELLANRVEGVLPTLEGIIGRAGIEHEIGRIRAPTLVMVGDQDVATVPAKALRIHQLIPGSRLEIIPGAGHTSSVEEPEAVNRVLVPFLTEVAGKGAQENAA